MSHQNFGSDPQFASNNVSYWHLSDIARSHEMSALTQRGRVLSSPVSLERVRLRLLLLNAAVSPQGWNFDNLEELSAAVCGTTPQSFFAFIMLSLIDSLLR